MTRLNKSADALMTDREVDARYGVSVPKRNHHYVNALPGGEATPRGKVVAS